MRGLYDRQYGHIPPSESTSRLSFDVEGLVDASSLVLPGILTQPPYAIDRPCQSKPVVPRLKPDRSLHCGQCALPKICLRIDFATTSFGSSQRDQTFGAVHSGWPAIA